MEKTYTQAEVDILLAACIERCAKVCDAIWDEFKGAGGRANTFGAGAVRGKAGCALELARAIRALKPEEQSAPDAGGVAHARFICPYCGETLPNAHSPHCGEVGHAHEENDDER